MRALILAAGRGSRMRGLTEEQPKCFVCLAGKRLLDWQMQALRQAGIDQIGVVTGYLAEKFEPLGIPSFHNQRWAETNMVRSLECAADWLRSEPCVVSYADILYHPSHIKSLMDKNADIGLTYDLLWENLWRDRFENPLSDAETFKINESGVLEEIGHRTDCRDDIQGQYMGLLKFTPDGWGVVEQILHDLLPSDVDRLDMTKTLSRMIAEGVEIETVPVSGRWCEVDNERDLHIYETWLQADKSWSHDWRWE